MSKVHDLVIVGTGPAGLTAAIYGARAALNPVIYAGVQHGGQLTTTTEVENFPGFPEGIMGPKLMEDLTKQAQRFGTQIIYDTISGSQLDGVVKELYLGDGSCIRTKTVVIATGATARTLGLAGEKEFMGRGLSTCATCDGFFYRNKKVAVIGGGDSAMEEANYLAKLCSEVILIHRRQEFRASPIMLERARQSDKIKFMTPFGVEATLGDKQGINGIRLKNLNTQATEDIALDGIFYAIGHDPNAKVFEPFVDVDSHGYIKVHEGTKTKTAGVFAAGDVADPVFKQAITAAGMGCQAAIQAQKYLEEQH